MEVNVLKLTLGVKIVLALSRRLDADRTHQQQSSRQPAPDPGGGPAPTPRAVVPRAPAEPRTSAGQRSLYGTAGVRVAGWRVDLDQIRLLFPPPAGDPFQHEVELANLRAIASNYRSAGAAKMIVAGVLESAQEVPRYVAALGVQSLLICRLVVDTDIVRARLSRRHVEDPDAREWHLRRTTELAAVLDRAGIDDVEVDSSRRDPLDVAHEVERHAGWALDG